MTDVTITQTFKLKPKKGLSVLDPITRKPLKTTGETKPKSEYWFRRIMDKTVIRMTEQEK